MSLQICDKISGDDSLDGGGMTGKDEARDVNVILHCISIPRNKKEIRTHSDHCIFYSA